MLPQQVLENPSLADAFRLAQEAVLQQLHVAMPGRIEVYSETTHLADVRPLVSTRTSQSIVRSDLPVIPNVPVIHPRGAKGAFLVPLAPGDLVTLLFSDHALDSWKASTGKPVEPGTNRRHHLTDCWAIPGGYPGAVPFSPAYGGALALQATPGTKIALGNGTAEVLDLLDQFINLFEVAVTGLFSTYALHTHVAAGVPTSAPSDAAGWTSALASLTAIRTLLGTLKA